MVTLYIATHNKTGKRYFGKTKRYFTEEDLQKYYHGSGKYWKHHLKKHGDDVTMEIYGIHSLNENAEDYVKPIAIRFSEDNNIVDYSIQANLEVETGLGSSGGMQTLQAIENFKKSRYSKESIAKNKKSRIIAEKKRMKIISTPEYKEKNKENVTKRINKSKVTKSTKEYKEKNNGKNHYSTNTIEIYNNKDKLMYISEGSFKDFCKEHKLPIEALKKSFRTNKRLYQTIKSKIIANKYGFLNFIGWYAVKVS